MFHFYSQKRLLSLDIIWIVTGRAGEQEPVGAGCFWPLGAGAGATRKKYQEPEPLEKKSGAGAGAAKKFAGSPALVTGYNLVSFLHNFMENISVLTKRNVLFNNEL